MVGQEDHYMKTLGRRECSFTNGERLSSDTLKELSPPPLSTNELNYPFQKQTKKHKKTKAPKDKNLLLFWLAQLTDSTVERRVWKKRMIFYKGQTAHLTFIKCP